MAGAGRGRRRSRPGGWLRRWRDRQGSASMVLLAAWGVIVVLLGMCFDLALHYVYLQQMRTAAEAAAAAGAMRAAYWMQVGFTQERYRQVERCHWYEEDTDGDGVAERHCDPYPDTELVGSQDLTVAGWERDVWTPLQSGQEFWQVPAYQPFCQRPPDNPAYGDEWTRCDGRRLVGCSLRERVPGMARAAAEDRIDRNRRWAGRLMDEQWQVRVDPDGPANLSFRVEVDTRARMPTMFLQLIGVPYLDVTVRPTVSAQWVRLSADPCGQFR